MRLRDDARMRAAMRLVVRLLGSRAVVPRLTRLADVRASKRTIQSLVAWMANPVQDGAAMRRAVLPGANKISEQVIS
jgi:hypothetical protein